MNNLQGIKVGDKVWSIREGWGVVTSCRTDIDCLGYPIEVDFGNDSGISRYTFDGRYVENSWAPELFFDIPEVFKNNEYPKRKEWRGNIGEFYFFIDSIGTINRSIETEHEIDDSRYNVGNYFRTIEIASSSDIYKIYNR